MKIKNILLSIVSILLILLLIIFCFLYFKFKVQLSAIKTIERVDDNVFSLTYRGSYGFDEFLSRGGAKTDSEVASYLTEFLSGGFYKSNVDSIDTGCSVFVKDEIFARNFDWVDAPIMITKTYPDDGYSSIATCNLSFLGFGDDFDPTSSFVSSLLSLASIYVPLDGINEKGLCVSDLVVDTPILIDQDKGKADLTITTLIRLLLDKAATVDEALELINSYDIHSSASMMHHLAISDRSGRSVVVEFYENEVYVTQSNIVTNFFLSDECPLYLTGSEQSKKRYEILKSKEIPLEAIKAVTQSNMDSDYELTLWSVLFNKAKSSATYYFRENFDKEYTFSL